jgi:hypothetical protein
MNIFLWGKLPACHVHSLVSLATVLLFVGCSTEDPQLAMLWHRLILAAEPESVTTIGAAKAAQAPYAAVQFVDSSGEPLAVDARKLFGIQVGDTVVIRGQGEVLADLDMFQVTADGIYVRRTGGGP